MIFVKVGRNLKRFTIELVTRCDSKVWEELGFLPNCARTGRTQVPSRLVNILMSKIK